VVLAALILVPAVVMVVVVPAVVLVVQFVLAAVSVTAGGGVAFLSGY